MIILVTALLIGALAKIMIGIGGSADCPPVQEQKWIAPMESIRATNQANGLATIPITDSSFDNYLKVLLEIQVSLELGSVLKSSEDFAQARQSAKLNCELQIRNDLSSTLLEFDGILKSHKLSFQDFFHYLGVHIENLWINGASGPVFSTRLRYLSNTYPGLRDDVALIESLLYKGVSQGAYGLPKKRMNYIVTRTAEENIVEKTLVDIYLIM